ncbi:MAG: SDR family oxidoreductase [Acidobacteria bacterium]|nr:SDR family oxidoreductase [Acidobacteriota bacterium]
MERKMGLVVGGLGVIGRNLVDHLTKLDDWDVTAVSRRRPDFESRARFISVDLLDRRDCEEKLTGLRTVTHMMYAALQPRPTLAAEVEPNLTMLRNAVEVIEAMAPLLQRIVLTEGVKAYGVHLGPFKTPAKETDARHMPPNFYYAQEDFLRERQAGRNWTWCVLRPDVVCGFSVGSPMNLTLMIAVYAAISKELGLPFRFPGKPKAYTSLAQFTDAELHARATVWAATDPRCANEIFNVANGDYYRWEELWSAFARFFDMPLAPPQTISLATFMADKGPVWDAIVRKHNLVPHPLEQIAAWPFGDFIFGCDYDVMSSTIKARRHGFADCIDSEEMFLRLFAQFRAARIIP